MDVCFCFLFVLLKVVVIVTCHNCNCVLYKKSKIKIRILIYNALNKREKGLVSQESSYLSTSQSIKRVIGRDLLQVCLSIFVYL